MLLVANKNDSPALHYPFTLSLLPYSIGALEPYMDGKTLDIHFHKHHAGYIAKLNAALKNSSEFHGMNIDKLLFNIESVPPSIRAEVRNQGGGHANHALFWRTIGPPRDMDPHGTFLSAINRSFGDLQKFKQQFTETALAIFGSGWVFLAVENIDRKSLKIIPTLNHAGVGLLGYTGILICDVWEHAYYLKYQNSREQYLKSFWNIVDWNAVSKAYSRLPFEGNSPQTGRMKGKFSPPPPLNSSAI
jgi:superoxide dismutase, Fe-Mn family